MATAAGLLFATPVSAGQVLFVQACFQVAGHREKQQTKAKACRQQDKWVKHVQRSASRSACCGKTQSLATMTGKAHRRRAASAASDPGRGAPFRGSEEPESALGGPCCKPTLKIWLHNLATLSMTGCNATGKKVANLNSSLGSPLHAYTTVGRQRRT